MNILGVIVGVTMILTSFCREEVPKKRFANGYRKVTHNRPPSHLRWPGKHYHGNRLSDLTGSNGDNLSPVLMPNGKIALPAIGPSYRYAGPQRLKGIYKRSLSSQRGQCQNEDWFVFWNSTGKCVPPLWDIDYDHVFCRYNEEVLYCACQEGQIRGMLKAANTCIDKDLAEIIGRCPFQPCPYPYECSEVDPGIRFDCYYGNMSVPIWY